MRLPRRARPRGSNVAPISSLGSRVGEDDVPRVGVKAGRLRVLRTADERLAGVIELQQCRLASESQPWPDGAEPREEFLATVECVIEQAGPGDSSFDHSVAALG